MTDLRELAERCEAATGPDRELDLRIEAAINPEYAGLDEEHARFLTRYGGHPSYTASLDAAMTLVPYDLDQQICKGPMFALAANAACPWGVSLIGPARDVDGEFGPEIDYDSFDANAATAPLAICAAALRAREEDRG